MTAKLGILLSGRGTNMEALADACERGVIDGKIAVVFSNVAAAPGVAKAKARGLRVEVVEHRGMEREAHEEKLLAVLESAGADIACCSGYMRLFTPVFVRPWEGRILNVHPALLPAFPGVDAQAQAIAYGVKVSGCTVHFVDERLDHGPIILQEAVEVRDDDTRDTLAERILEVEHRLYPEAVALVASGRVRLDGRRVVRA